MTYQVVEPEAKPRVIKDVQMSFRPIGNGILKIEEEKIIIGPYTTIKEIIVQKFIHEKKPDDGKRPPIHVYIIKSDNGKMTRAERMEYADIIRKVDRKSIQLLYDGPPKELFRNLFIDSADFLRPVKRIIQNHNGGEGEKCVEKAYDSTFFNALKSYCKRHNIPYHSHAQALK